MAIAWSGAVSASAIEPTTMSKRRVKAAGKLARAFGLLPAGGRAGAQPVDEAERLRGRDQDVVARDTHARRGGSHQAELGRERRPIERAAQPQVGGERGEVQERREVAQQPV